MNIKYIVELLIAGLAFRGYTDNVTVTDDSQGDTAGEIEIWTENKETIWVAGWIKIQMTGAKLMPFAVVTYESGSRGALVESSKKSFHEDEEREMVAYAMGKMLEAELIEALP